MGEILSKDYNCNIYWYTFESRDPGNGAKDL